MKNLRYYETKLGSILPIHLLPRLTHDPIMDEVIVYREIVREMYGCLCYLRGLTSKVAEKMVMELFVNKFAHIIRSENYRNMFSEEVRGVFLN